MYKITFENKEKFICSYTVADFNIATEGFVFLKKMNELFKWGGKDHKIFRIDNGREIEIVFSNKEFGWVDKK